jgi:hypothetical protein
MKFDHIEVHVKDIQKYCTYLQTLFNGGIIEIISKSGTSMFISPDGINIEVKKKTIPQEPINCGFCNPSLRMKGAKAFIENTLKYEIIDVKTTPNGYSVYFFKDYEGVVWHIKDIPDGIKSW